MQTNEIPKGAALQPLSKPQIRDLVLLARTAYGRIRPYPRESFDAWRHRHCMMCVERGGLTECLNEDYLPLRAHLLELCGRSHAARDAREKHLVEGRSWVRARLRMECDRAADVLPGAMDYAAGFVRNKRGLCLEDADEKTLWHAIYVVRRRAAQLRRKGATA